jgi:hypothetical protein
LPPDDDELDGDCLCLFGGSGYSSCFCFLAAPALALVALACPLGSLSLLLACLVAGSGAIWLVVVAVVFVGGVVLRVERVVSGVCLGRWVVRSVGPSLQVASSSRFAPSPR